MSNSITDFLAAILSAKYGEQVRGAIHDAIELCYQDGKAGVNDLEARHLIEQVIGVNEMQDAGIETLTARVEALEQGGEGESAGTTTTTVPTFIVDHGIANFSNVQANKTATMNVTFAKTFTEAPVVAAIKVFRNGPNTFYSLVTAQPVESSITSTGFTLAVGNRYTQAVSPSVLWIAFQPTEIEINTEIIVPSGDGMTEAEVRELLAPISAALNGIKTGYDGTVYDTPGEAVREQINNLHVLIGEKPGTAIDASAVGYNYSNVADELDGLHERLDQYEDVFSGDVDESVANWLDEHPEATTRVQDGSLTELKFADALKLKTVKDYVTPEMYGAKGDGTTDDTQAIQSAINSGKHVRLLSKIYLVKQTIYIDQFTSIVGYGAGWNAGGTVINASGDFLGDYIFSISHENTNYCRSVNIRDINLDCNNTTGGIYAVHLYDASVFENINITRVGAGNYGLNIASYGHCTQTFTGINVLCVSDTNNQRDNTKALINFERLQECTLINVKAFSNNSNAFDILGCQTLALISCAAFDYTGNGKAYNIGMLSKEGYNLQRSYNINMVGCLNEGCAGGLCISGMFQILSGTFTEYASGTVITQDNASGVIASGTASSINVIPTTGKFTTGACSAGTVTSVTDRIGHGFEIDYQPKLHDLYSAVTVKGVSDSTIRVKKTIGYSTGVDYSLENNHCTNVIVAPDDVHTMSTDNTSEVSQQAPVVLFSGSSGGAIKGLPTVAFEGLTVVIYSTKVKYDCRLTLPIDSIYGTRYLGFCYFTKAILKVVGGKFVIIECDGDVVDKTNNVFIWDKKMETVTLATSSTMATGFISNVHYINEGARRVYTVSTNATFKGRKIKVSSVNGYAITVGLLSGATFPDGTTSMTVNAGETKTFEVLAAGIVNAQ